MNTHIIDNEIDRFKIKIMIDKNRFKIVVFRPEFKPQLINLLLLLHEGYFNQIANEKLRVLKEHFNVRKTFANYLTRISRRKNYRILIAFSDGTPIGFIIGSIAVDKDHILSRKGIIEDWFVDGAHAKKSVGTNLYAKLEEWFLRNKCVQVQSDTWFGNEISVKAHKKIGLEITGYKFGKILN